MRELWANNFDAMEKFSLAELPVVLSLWEKRARYDSDIPPAQTATFRLIKLKSI
jgi:hypothetical protein